MWIWLQLPTLRGNTCRIDKEQTEKTSEWDFWNIFLPQCWLFTIFWGINWMAILCMPWRKWSLQCQLRVIYKIRWWQISDSSRTHVIFYYVATFLSVVAVSFFDYFVYYDDGVPFVLYNRTYCNSWRAPLAHHNSSIFPWLLRVLLWWSSFRFIITYCPWHITIEIK